MQVKDMVGQYKKVKKAQVNEMKKYDYVLVGSGLFS